MLQLYGSSIVADQTGAWKIPPPKKGMKSIYFKYFIYFIIIFYCYYLQLEASSV